MWVKAAPCAFPRTTHTTHPFASEQPSRTHAHPNMTYPPQNEPLDAAGTAAALGALTEEVNAHEEAAGKAAKTVDEVAMGFVQVANEAMCRPIRALTQVGARLGV
jgi:N-methylhydantoinase A/oxoprolinase/acetone carboxylase beta subunit